MELVGSSVSLGRAVGSTQRDWRPRGAGQRVPPLLRGDGKINPALGTPGPARCLLVTNEEFTHPRWDLSDVFSHPLTAEKEEGEPPTQMLNIPQTPVTFCKLDSTPFIRYVKP